jgi:hypothetical protein
MFGFRHYREYAQTDIRKNITHLSIDLTRSLNTQCEVVFSRESWNQKRSNTGICYEFLSETFVYKIDRFKIDLN